MVTHEPRLNVPEVRTPRRRAGAVLSGAMWLAVSCGSVEARTPPAGGDSLDFARDVRPILAANCFRCHGPDEAVRQGELRLDTLEGALAVNLAGRSAVVPGAPERSLLVERVSTGVLDDRMPPVEVNRNGLKRADIDTLRRWISEGAPWSTHWAFEAPKKQPEPRVADPAWCRNRIDRFVLARLEEEGLRPSAQAVKATLLRRVSLDLTGLPPTPAEVERFEADESPDAYERAVDGLLASPRFGEKWARWWLDLARYADTKGYEKDDRRTMWPYRDWVIRAFNDDMPFDRFSIEQLAGDMLPDATQDQLIATAFHRNTMTNDEGGTDDEEFRVAAVIDRVNTTAEIWGGLTMGCAQCHSHKYDPITQTDYYRFLAYFNNTEDADRPDEAPVIPVLSDEDRARLESIRAARSELERRLGEATAEFDTPALDDPGTPPERLTQPADFVWIDDLLPVGSVSHVEPEGGAWPWAGPGVATPQSGVRCFGKESPGGAAQQYVTDIDEPLPVSSGDLVFAYVFVAADSLPAQVIMQWHTAEEQWAHRAYWGVHADSIYGGRDGTPSLRRVGDLPTPGKWVRLEVPASEIGLEGKHITGWAFSQVDGTVYWDNAGLRTTTPPDTRSLTSFTAWVEHARAAHGPGLPEALRAVIEKPPGEWTDAERHTLRGHYLTSVHAGARAATLELRVELDELAKAEEALLAPLPHLPILRELSADRGRATHRLARGSFLNPAERVDPGIPAVFFNQGQRQPADRLGLARWLVSEDNPLGGRAVVNRMWEQVFGEGLARTVEDLGTQGEWPSDRELLDDLSVRFRTEHHWSVKGLLREIVTSATYQQSSGATQSLLVLDPGNRKLARGPRTRLDGEMIRDQALAAAGLLSDKMYGPPVFPPQPDGLWIMIYSGDRWNTSSGEDRHRRALYTFWRRTVPYPSMTTFDAPSREFCVSRRIRTNTPLQAFVTLNDPAFVECAQAMARRIALSSADAGQSDIDRIRGAFRLVVARAPDAEEIQEVKGLLDRQRARYRESPGASVAAACDPLGPLPDGADPVELASWTTVCSTLLNLDEALTKE